jgi:hypothetical protein
MTKKRSYRFAQTNITHAPIYVCQAATPPCCGLFFVCVSALKLFLHYGIVA